MRTFGVSPELVRRLLSLGEFLNSVPFVKRHSTFFATLALFVLAFLTYYFTGRGATKFDYFVPLADGFLHGRLSLVNPSPILVNDELVHGAYVIYPPMPAIVLLPAVAVWGLDVNQALASALFGGLNTSLVFLLMKHFTDSLRLRLWLAVLFGFGTIHWWLASVGSAWYFAHIISFFFLILAIFAVLTNRRPFVIGLLLGASYWTRLTTIFSLPFFVIMLAERWRQKSNNPPVVRRVRFATFAAPRLARARRAVPSGS